MSGSDGPSPGATVLIIEEDEVTATDLQTGLTSAGYGVLRAGSADEALSTLDSAQVDVILMSLMLPDTDGLILCSTLKATSPVPVIITSGRAREVDRALALESGAADVLALPVDHQELLVRVSALVRQPPVSSQTRGV